MYKFLLITLLLYSSLVFSKNEQDNLEVESTEDQVLIYTLPTSRSTLILPASQYKVYVGDNAQRFWKSFMGEVNNDLEAIVIKDETEFIQFEYHNTGYMPLTGWNEVSTDSMIEQICESIEVDNHARRLQGLHEINILKWLYKPFFYEKLYMCAGTARIKEGEDDGLIGLAVKLNKYGYERIVWVSGTASEDSFSEEFFAMIMMHEFDSASYHDGDVTKIERLRAKVYANVILGLILFFLIKKVIKSGIIVKFFKSIAKLVF